MEIAEFKPLELADKDILAPMIADAKPVTSELTFTNLFMWRSYYRPMWRLHDGCLLIIMDPVGSPPFGMQPLGAGDRTAAVRSIFGHMEKAGAEPLLARVDQPFAARLAAEKGLRIEPDRDQFDYVYAAQDLVSLAGRKFHRKKNHYNKFAKSIPFSYKPLNVELVEQVLDMQEHWCQMRECGGDPSLINEDLAIHEALANFDKLDFVGGAICVQDNVEAFSFGEALNNDTAVIHIEKANPEMPGLYAVINREFAAAAWQNVKYINREQDLGIDGLRAAKESYRPDHLVEKYIVRPV